MSGLHTFRSRLAGLKLRRALVRWQTAIAQVLVYVVIALFALLVIDFSLRLPMVARAMLILVAGGVLVWQALRRIGPNLFQNETLVDIALLLERTHGVDSDLVAALQFDASVHESAGSRELQRAVIDRAAKISETLDFRSAVPKKDASRAVRYAATAVLSLAVGWFAFPSYASAFWNRLWLGDANYPTRTRIDEVAVNGRTDAARVVEGEAVVFQVRCSGVTPNSGIAKLRGLETGDSTSVMLNRVDETSHAATYVADGPPMNEQVEYSIQIGDAATEFRRIALIQRPLVELTIEAEAPAYMQHQGIRQHEHYVQVLEGSAVRLTLRCTNGKRLKEARFELIDDDEQVDNPTAIAFVPTDDSRLTWHLDPRAAGLARVVKDCQFRVAVVDEDGLATYHPIEGAVRVKPDHPPTATLSSLHHAIRPNARPTIACTSEDDFGIASLTLRARCGATRETEAEETIAFDLPLQKSRVAVRRTTVRAEHILDLSPLGLVERDKVLVWIESTDYRGEWPGVSTLSEVIELEVTDERGVVDAILRSDADAEQMLTDVIEKELGLRSER
ncbi:MAG: hypothetical protein ABI614_15565 [Planctomycetota bacterium]